MASSNNTTVSKPWTIVNFPVTAGTEVMRNEPWIYSLHPRNFNELCYRCFKQMDPKKPLNPDLFAKSSENPSTCVQVLPCPGCGVVKYCSQECQDADKVAWRHGMECSLLKKLHASGGTPHHDMLIILKIMARLQNDDGASSRNSKPWIYTGRDYNRQLSHSDEILQNDVWMKDAEELRHLLEAVMDESDIPDLRSLVEMYGKLKVNSFDLRDQYLRRLGEGFYFEAAKFDHSCHRNALFFFDGLTLVIRAIEDIPDSLKVRVSYIELFTTTSIRQKNLEWFFFRCGCPLCNDPKKIADMEVIRCCTPNCERPIPLDTDTRNRDPCPDCLEYVHTQLNQDPNSPWNDFNWHNEIDQRLTQAKKLLEEHSKQHDTIFRQMDDASVTRPGGEGQRQEFSLDNVRDACEKMLVEGKDLLHPANWTRCITHNVLARAYLAQGDPDKRTHAGKHFGLALPGIKRALRPNDTRIGVQALMAALLPLTAPGFFEEKTDDARNTVKECQTRALEAKRIFGISDGNDRGLYRISDSLVKLCAESQHQQPDQAAWLEKVLDTLSELVCRSLFPVVY